MKVAEINVNDVVQFQAEETPNTDDAFRAFYALSFADKLDAIYELLCRMEDKKVSDGKTFFHNHAAGIPNGYDSAFHTMNYKESIFGVDDEDTELPI